MRRHIVCTGQSRRDPVANERACQKQSRTGPVRNRAGHSLSETEQETRYEERTNREGRRRLHVASGG